jgi:hypothetical protein
MYLIISALQNGTIINKKGYYALQKEDLITLFVPSAVQNEVWMMHFIISALQNGTIINKKAIIHCRRRIYLLYFSLLQFRMKFG